jgi:hypothetical protein
MANEAQNFKIRFEGLSVAEAGNKAEGLRRDLLEVSPDVRVKIEQEDPSNQDFGATLVLILGAPAAVALAKGVADYLRRVGGKITIEADGKIIGENISGDDIGKIEQALSSRR